MSFSDINVEQRSKEVEALRSFLAYSLIGSLVLHIGLLASGIGGFLTRVPGEEEPMELAIIDPATEQPEKPPEEIIEDTKAQPNSGSLGGGNGIEGGGYKGGSKSANSQSVVALERKPEVVPQPKAIAQKQPIATTPVQKTQTTQNIKTPTQQTPTNQLSQEVVTQPSAPTSQSGSATQGSDNLRQLLGGIRDSRATQGNAGGSVTATGSGIGNGTGNGIGNGNGSGNGSGTGTGSGFGKGPGTGIGNGTGTGNGNGPGNGTGNGTGTGTGTGTNKQPANPPIVATAPTPPKINTSSGNGRAACREGGCSAKYPESARRRGIQGRVEVAVDTDAQGNVTNVRVTSSSGNRELDEETKRQARNWKLKPSEGGRQGIAIGTEYALRGTRRYEQVQERKRQREARERNQQTTASNTNSTEGTSRRKPLITSSSTNIPAERSTESRRDRRVRRQPVQTAATNSSSQGTATRSQGNVRESLRGLRRQRVSNNSSQQPQTSQNRRRRRDNNSSSSQNKLRESLRRLRQPSQSQPTGSQ
ncbi:energy transducer TonB [Nostoc sp. CENA67]|uniref:Energy transducer TonB n=1 Tax=Amazonocrinis nigriterrae CENA67 TaxID=2794033 RepID=A0A8J7HMN4_9NOST|nr:energy transducer TonB [Amazonocrinis nigriterrae]MBH8562107.1 energy transducer TonB [Amazonocrinis nigriterrae CENA67]